ncbi:MAG: TolC family protein, partial [Sediminibacterium sp.]
MILRQGFIIILLLTFIDTNAQTPEQTAAKHEFSVQQCVDYAGKNNVQIKNALINVQLQEQTNRGITSAALPNISGAGSFTDYLKIPTNLLPGEFFGQPAGTFIPVQFGTKYNVNAGVTLQQILFDGQVFIGLQARKTSIDWSKKSVDVTMTNLKSVIYKVYYQLVVSKTQVAQLDANIERVQKQEHDANEMFKNGFVEKIDVDRASVQLANLLTEKASVENQIANGYLGLKLLIGMPIKDSLVLTDKITDDDLKEGLLNEGEYDYNNRVEYQYVNLGKMLNEYNIKRYKLAAIPTLSLTGNYSYQAQRSEFDFFGEGQWFKSAYIGLNLNVPIFDGFKRKSNLQSAMLTLQQTNNQLTFLKDSIDKEVKEASNN